MARAPALLFAPLLPLVFAACNALTGLGDDYHLAGDDDDAGTPPSDGAAGHDARPLADAADAADASATAFCDGQTEPFHFCDDFESTTGNPPFDWDGHEAIDATLAIADGAGKGGSRGLRAHAEPGSADGDSAKASLWRTIADGPAQGYGHYELSFEFEIEEDTLEYGALGVFAFQQAMGAPLRSAGVASYARRLDVTDPPGVLDSQRVADQGGWHTARITLDRPDGGSGYDLVVAVDGTVVEALAGYDVGSGPSVEIRIGAFFTSKGPGAIKVVLDNVLVRRAP
jgi:hypothetical protein